MRRIVSTVVAAAAMSAAAAAAMVALSYALYALLRDPLTPAGAAALTALAMALVAAVVGLVFLRRGRSDRHDEADGGGPAAMLQQRAFQLARAQPLLLVGAGIAGLYVLLRHPGVLALIGSNLIGMRMQKRKDKRRGLI